MISILSPATRIACAAALSLWAAPNLLAAPSAQQVFPQHTVLWFSLPQAQQFQQKFSQTQLGRLAEDESLAPFCEHLRQQAVDKFGNMQASLGVTLDDALDAAGAELALGIAHKPGSQAATIVTIDPQGREQQAAKLRDKIQQAMADRNAKRSEIQLAGVAAIVYQLPMKADARITREPIVEFEAGGLLCYAEGQANAQALAAQINGGGAPSLTDRKDFAQTMARCKAAQGGAPDVRWFVNPFAYDAAQRTREAKPLHAEKDDTITLLRGEGFDAIQGIGGHVQVAVDPGKDFVHRTALYAPPKPGAKGRPAAEKYERGMRMAETPNRTDMDVEAWAPRSTANYSTFSLDVDNAFDNLGTLFDAMSGYDGAFKNTLEGFERDPYGPKIKFREEIIANLGDRITRMADYKLPVSTECERFLFVIDAKNPAKLKVPVDKWMENDGAELRSTNGIEYWEIVPEEETETKLDLGGGLIPLDDQASDPEDEEALLRRAAVCVHNGKLVIASDVEFMLQAVFGVAQADSLAGTYDYQSAMQALNSLVRDPQRCSWSFTRTDESVRPTYELMRQGKLPEGQTFFARLVNKLLTTAEDEEKGIVRHQRVDASRLPTFELARRYFGPAARAIKSEDDGWFITGVVLSKADGQQVARNAE